MRCHTCNRKAVFTISATRLSFCKEHYLEYFVKRVEKTIHRYRMLDRSRHVILIAVSGGKDSLTLWKTLKLLGIRTHGFHLDLGISAGDYSKISREKTVKFADKERLPLTIISLKEELGITIDDYRIAGQRSACSTCGLIKRYFMNQFGKNIRADAVATGHNLDDEVAVLFPNILNWQTGYLRRQAPVLDSWHPGLTKKIKPLVEISEREVAAFAIMSDIDYVMDECPYSKGATTIFYKELLSRLEERSPGSKLRFYRGFLENKDLFREKEDFLEPCEICGLPTIHSPCAFCRLKNRITVAKS